MVKTNSNSSKFIQREERTININLDYDKTTKEGTVVKTKKKSEDL